MTTWELVTTVLALASAALAETGQTVDREVAAGWEPAADCDGLYVWLAGMHTSQSGTLAAPPGGIQCFGVPVATVGLRYDRCITVREGAPSATLLAAEGEPFVEASQAIYIGLLEAGLEEAFGDCQAFFLGEAATSVQGAIASFELELEAVVSEYGGS